MNTVTLKQVATYAGTSVPAASRVLNGKGAGYSADTIRRVELAAQELGYRPNWRARALARRRSQCIGLIYGRPADYVERSRFVSGLVEELAKRDHDLMLIPAVGHIDQWGYKLRDNRVDGCIITHPMPIDLDELVAEHRLPAVLANVRSELNVPQVSFDDRAGAQQAVRHLVELGHKRILFFIRKQGHGEHYSVAERHGGFRQAMSEAGLTPRESLEEFQGAAEFADWMLSLGKAERPTAVLSYNDNDAVALLHELWRRQIVCPRDLSVVGFNDDLSARQVLPPLTTVAVPAGDAVRHCIDLLLEQIDAEDPHLDDAARIVLPEQLVVRSSTGAPAL